LSSSDDIDKDINKDLPEKETRSLIRDQINYNATKLLQETLQYLLNHLQAHPTEIDKSVVDMTSDIHEIALTIMMLNIDSQEIDLEKILKQTIKRADQLREQSQACKRLDKQER
jgi:hypothetical protein